MKPVKSYSEAFVGDLILQRSSARALFLCKISKPFFGDMMLHGIIFTDGAWELLTEVVRTHGPVGPGMIRISI